MRVDRLSETYHLAVKYVHFPLHPETPDEGQSLEQLFAGRGLDIPRMQADMAARMRAEGLEYGDRTMTCNSRRAQELACWAATQPVGEAIHLALFVAYFVEGVNLAVVDRLVDIAARVGLDPDAARRILEARQFRAAVSADWQRSRQLGVTGVPTYVAGGKGVVGAQPYEVLEQLVQEAGAQKR